MLRVIETLLKNTPQGMSTRQLSLTTGISQKSLKWFIYNSKNITDCDPRIHGSYKQKIRVYSFKPSEMSYIETKKINKNRKKKNNNVEYTQTDHQQNES
jgi:hypothetical protein